jgi:hypothetical protein
MRKTLTSLALIGVLSLVGCSQEREIPKERGIVEHIGFVRNSQESKKNSSLSLNISNQNASGGGFLSEGGKIYNRDESDKSLIIRMKSLSPQKTTKMIYVRDDDYGVPASILLDYISIGDTIKIEGIPYGNFNSSNICVFNPEQISKINY